MVVLALVNLVDQADIAILRGVLPILEDEWSLSDLQLGLLGFVFVFLNALTTIPAGWLADHTRRTRLIGWTLLSWTGLIALSATAVNYVNLLGARAVMGIGQAVDDPASTSLVGDYYPSRLRARAFSLQQVSLFVGGGIGLALGGFVGETLGWRWAFARLAHRPARVPAPGARAGRGRPARGRPAARAGRGGRRHLGGGFRAAGAFRAVG
jgi:MFS family permease